MRNTEVLAYKTTHFKTCSQ